MQEQMESQRRADVSAEVISLRFTEGTSRTEDEYEFRITNGGPAIARELHVWLRAGEDISTGAEPAFRPLSAGQYENITITTHPKLRYSRQPVQLMATWRDETGQHPPTVLADLGVIP